MYCGMVLNYLMMLCVGVEIVVVVCMFNLLFVFDVDVGKLMVLIGVGMGIVLFCGFLEECVVQQVVGEVVVMLFLCFGCCYFEYDFFYCDILCVWENVGVVCVFVVYLCVVDYLYCFVQYVFWDVCEVVWVVFDVGVMLYVCGDGCVMVLVVCDMLICMYQVCYGSDFEIVLGWLMMQM